MTLNLLSKLTPSKSSLILSLFALTLYSCAGTGENVTPIQKTYSAETEKTFEDIEREQVLENYRKLRWENWERRQNERSNQAQSKPRYQRVRPKPAPPKQVSRPTRPRPSGNPEEIQVEIEQNMAIFCMKMSGKSRFSNDNDCVAYTENVLYECSSKYEEDDKRRVGCVKSELR